MNDVRQQAIAAMQEASWSWYQSQDEDSDFHEYAGVLLDAIPGDVHAQIAIDKGALIETDIYEAEKIARTEQPALLLRLVGKDPQP